MRTSRLLFAAFALLIAASSARAASVSIVADQPFYNFGDTVTLTVIGTANAGEASTQVFGALQFSNPAAVGGPNATQTALESFGGAIPWTLGTNPCDSSICTAMNQICCINPLTPTNTPLAIATVTFTLSAPGTLDITWDESTFDFFGATNQPGISIAPIPEPASVGLLALGLTGLAAARRRRRGGAPPARVA